MTPVAPVGSGRFHGLCGPCGTYWACFFHITCDPLSIANNSRLGCGRPVDPVNKIGLVDPIISVYMADIGNSIDIYLVGFIDARFYNICVFSKCRQAYSSCGSGRSCDSGGSYRTIFTLICHTSL